MMRRRLNPESLRKITFATQVHVRFSEVDSLGMVWHGHYIQYFEAAREAFGRQYGLDYKSMIQSGIVVPIVETQVFHHAPARLDDCLEITVHTIEHQAAKLELYYEIRRMSDKTFIAEGRTLQVCTTPEGALIITQPELLRTFYANWGSQFQ